MIDFTHISVVASHTNKPCSVFALQKCLGITLVRLDPLPIPGDQLNPNDTDMTKALLSCDVTSEVSGKPSTCVIIKPKSK